MRARLRGDMFAGDMAAFLEAAACDSQGISGASRIIRRHGDAYDVGSVLEWIEGELTRAGEAWKTTAPTARQREKRTAAFAATSALEGRILSGSTATGGC